MLTRIIFFTLTLFTQSVFAQQKIQFDKSPALPVLLAENMISTGFNERDFALSPDGMEVYYTIQSGQGVFQTILCMKKDRSGSWSKPEVASFAGRYSDLEPSFSPDGTKLFFSSNRPLTGTAIKDFDIWVVEKKNNDWSEPRNIGAPVNTPANEFYPSVTKSGNLYFTAAYKHAVSKEDIWMARWENEKYSEAVLLDTAINSKMYEFNAYVSPGEELIIFTAYGRKDDKGGGDLYMSMKDASGKWMPAKNLSFLNSDKLDYCPFVSFDKKSLFFTSERHSLKSSYLQAAVKAAELTRSLNGPQNGLGDIYWVDFNHVIDSYRK
ncbi:MAG TPA: hypothetical protein VGO58_05455 [Chitinophagaceae bacterium]|jgi:Tol biopolymer transport system component|nr:hypothetical protein [Chitinophagaceae bacterium]